MPSGPKRRKAAKKKKAQHPHPSHEHDDPRQHEEKDSDGGEADVLSPASQGNSDPFPNDGAEEFENPPPVGSIASQSKSPEVNPVDSVAVPKGGVEEIENVEIVKEVQSEDISESKTIDIECVQVEAREISANGNEEKNNSAGLENGSHAVEEKLEQEEVDDAVLEASSQSNELAKEMNCLPEEPVQVLESSLVINSVEPVSSIPGEKIIIVTETLVEGSPADSSTELRDQEKKMAPLIDEASQVSEPVPEVSSKNIDETTASVTDEITGKSPSGEKEAKLLVIQEVSIARATSVVETTKEYERPEPSETQPLVAPASKVLQKTSLFSCCGIFDVITGSSR